jgi:hypothetical protein
MRHSSVRVVRLRGPLGSHRREPERTSRRPRQPGTQYGNAAVDRHEPLGAEHSRTGREVHGRPDLVGGDQRRAGMFGTGARNRPSGCGTTPRRPGGAESARPGPRHRRDPRPRRALPQRRHRGGARLQDHGPYRRRAGRPYPAAAQALAELFSVLGGKMESGPGPGYRAARNQSHLLRGNGRGYGVATTEVDGQFIAALTQRC